MILLLSLDSCSNSEKPIRTNLFTILNSDSTNLDFNNKVNISFKHNINKYHNFLNGAGVAVGDINNDGYEDIFFGGNLTSDKLFLNKGNLTFEDISSTAIKDSREGWSNGVQMIDINNDGWKDIYICRSWYFEDSNKRKNVLLINNKDNTFSEMAETYGLADTSFSTNANFFDFDNDGDLDVYMVVHPIDYADKDRYVNHQKIETNSNMTDKFLLNDNGVYIDYTSQVGLNNHGYGLSATVGDLNNDGWTDIYVANDWSMYDYLYLNINGEYFEDYTKRLLDKTSYYGMGSDIQDINNDGLEDIVVLDMGFNNDLKKTFMLDRSESDFKLMVGSGYFFQYPRNTMHINHGTKFSETALGMQVANTEWSWSPLLIDMDNDGFKDLFVSNGYLFEFNVDNMPVYSDMITALRLEDSISFYSALEIVSKEPLKTENYFFKITNDSIRNETFSWGSDIKTISHGAAFADFDNDGDIDIVVNNTNENAFIYRNNSEKLLDSHYIDVKLVGGKNNKQALGSIVDLYINSSVQSFALKNSQGYLSSSSNIIHFGVSSNLEVDSLVVRWPGDQMKSVLYSLKVDTTYIIDKNEANLIKSVQKNKKNQFFLNTSSKYQSAPDALIKSLQRRTLSTFQVNEPCISIVDLDEDGKYEVFLGNFQTSNKECQISEFVTVCSDTVLLPIEDENHIKSLSSYYSDKNKRWELFIQRTHNVDILYYDKVSKSYLMYERKLDIDFQNYALSEVNPDNQDILMLGGIVPNFYPKRYDNLLIDSILVENVCSDGGDDKYGQYNDILWSDFDNDFDLDVVLVGHLRPISFFKNNGNGLFEETTNNLSSINGLFNAVSSGDFNNDGYLDYVFGNHGINDIYSSNPKSIYTYFVNDFDDNGILEMILCYQKGEEFYTYDNLQRVSEQLPEVQRKYSSSTDFAKAKFSDIVGAEKMKDAKKITLNRLKSFVAINTQDGNYKIKELPIESQLAPIYGIVSLDVNLDGNLDLIIQGNYYNMNYPYNKQDAGFIHQLMGDGNGNFEFVRNNVSGLNHSNDASGIALISDTKNDLELWSISRSDKVKKYGISLNHLVFQKNEQKCFVTYNNGQRAIYESTMCGSFKAQCPTIVAFNPAMVCEISFYNSKNEQTRVFTF